MDVQVTLDDPSPVYTNHDQISGAVVLSTESAVRLSAITVSLLGISISRATSGSQVKKHQLFRKTYTLFPPSCVSGIQTYTDLTIGNGRHVFLFSIAFPQVSECYKTEIKHEPFFICNPVKLRHWRRKETHLLRRLPPSFKEPRATAEIKYRISVAVSGKNIPKNLQEQNRDIIFCPLSDPIPAQMPFEQSQLVQIRPDVPGLLKPVSLQLDMKLLDGPCLSLGHSLPLSIEITKLGDCNCGINLKEFQTMLIDTTQIRAESSFESFDRCWLIQTTANMKHPVFPEGMHSGFTTCLSDKLWANHYLPSSLVPNFEVCNIRKTYQLEVRLGVEVAFPKTQTFIREFRFPVHLAWTDANWADPFAAPSPISSQNAGSLITWAGI